MIEQPFPAEAELERLAAQPAPELPALQKVRTIDSWRLRGPLPTTTSSLSASDADARALAGLVSPRHAVTQAMGCLARELASFVLQHGAEPSHDLVAWIAGRCGVGHANARVVYGRHGDMTADVLDLTRDRAEILAMVQALPGACDFGIAVVDDGKHRMMVITAVPRAVTLDPVPMTATHSKVVVTGVSAFPIGWVTGHATLGDDRFGECEPVASARTGPKAFALACPVDGRDAAATIEIAIAPVGQLLGDVAVSLWVSPDGSLGDSFTATRIPVPIDGQEQGALAWLTAINSVRERAGLAAWSHAAAQSELVGGLLPHMVAAQNQPKQRDQLVLGMLAGWKVEGTIRDGNMRLAVVPRDVPFDRVFGAAMSSPSFRAVVLSPDSATAAVAALPLASSNVSQLAVVGYSLFQARDYLDEQESFLDQLDADRVSRGLPAVERVGGPRDRAVLDAAATRVRNGESAPMEELDGLLQHFSEATGQTMRGAVFTTLTLDGCRPPFDGVLADAPNVVVVTKIADWRPPGSAWGQHVIYVVYAVPGETGG